MNQRERLSYLLDEFKKDSEEYQHLIVGESEEEQKQALRSLMNIRMPKSMDEQILEIQDEFLTQDAEEKGIVTLEEIPNVKEAFGSKTSYADQISIWQGDITRLNVDAIVNAANSQMLGCFIPCHKCIDNAIHSAAGIQLRSECNHKMNQKRIRYGRQYEEPTGQAMLTKGYNLPAKYVIHTVGPIVQGRLQKRHEELLASCYRSCLELAQEHGIKSIAFCCISTGVFMFPNKRAAQIAVETVKKYYEETKSQIKVVFNVFKDEDLSIYQKILS